MLQDLPVELLHNIAEKLHQQEIVSLSRTNSFFNKLLLPRLYSAVTVESTPKVFENSGADSSISEIQQDRFQVGNVYLSSIKITSVYALKLFFKCLIRHPEYCSYVKVLVFKSQIPDIEDSNLFIYLKHTLYKMNNLKVFRLDKKSINVNLEWFNQGICEIQGRLVGSSPHQFNLKSLGLINTCDSSSAKTFCMKNLQELAILKSADLNVFDNLFKNSTSKIRLRKLIIENSYLDITIADLLNKHLELDQLQSLSVPLCDGSNPMKYNEFLIKLIAYMNNLSELTFTATDHRLLPSLKYLGLSKLKVLCDSNKFDLGLILAKVNSESLLRLDICPTSDISSRGKCPTSPNSSLKLLGAFSKLKMLSLPVTDEEMLVLPSYLPSSLEMLIVQCLSPDHIENSLIFCEHYGQTFQMVRENKYHARFVSIVEKFGQKLPKLKWGGFEKANKTYLYQNHEGKVMKHDGSRSDIEPIIMKN
ncbi:uncharacterized protein SPAPADRAFT_51580 [Spathaspora passalidarum NRRL Y-27907]|uniref:F-box domain-containing protein n=1 Tax=Spathaspora passalidarum (strain NRRL Y-27907 / 11-Y1) TaxID=619300 RepID=G3AQN6_SPAPN|nr:uncharacterized protein SPAPADRAFT_51580 [Spathaspora passalidarum NRRL Y-27907]EGW31583.1 hypothetical protein SPAPADRAFT_51580 [Spathaspora passalidarum NRRL Y-27907]